MKNQLKLVNIAIMMALLLGPFISSVGAMPTTTMTHPTMPPENRMPDHRVGSDGTVWISTDIITIMANNEVPMFHFWFTADENGSMTKFSTTYLNIIEFMDSNDDGAYQNDEVLYFAPLAAYEWTVQTGSVVDDDGAVSEVWLKYVKGGLREGGMHPDAPSLLMAGHGSVQRFEDVTIQIWAHIYLDDYYGNVTDDKGVHANFTVAGGYELKMDIEIGNFPFSSNESSVALQVLLRENEAMGSQMRHHISTREQSRVMNMTSDMNWTQSEMEHRFENRNNTHVQEVEFTNDVTGVPEGFFKWVDKALITLPGGETQAVNVSASYIPVGMGVALTLAYPNFDDGTLLHDPSIGLYPDAIPETGTPTENLIIMGVGIVAVLAIVVVIAKKR